MSSEDPTQNLPGDRETKPTLEAVIHRIDRLGALMLEQFKEINSRFDLIDVRLDRMASEIKETHAELYTLRADFKEFRAHFKEPA